MYQQLYPWRKCPTYLLNRRLAGPELVRIFCISIAKISLLKLYKKIITESFAKPTKHTHSLVGQNVEFLQQLMFIITTVLCWIF
jgi:hypothetical protein